MDKFTIIANGAENRRGEKSGGCQEDCGLSGKTSEGMCDFTGR